MWTSKFVHTPLRFLFYLLFIYIYLKSKLNWIKSSLLTKVQVHSWFDLIQLYITSLFETRDHETLAQETIPKLPKLSKIRESYKPYLQPLSKHTNLSNRSLKWYRVRMDQTWWSKAHETNIPCISGCPIFRKFISLFSLCFNAC